MNMDIEERFWLVFERALGVEVDHALIKVSDLEEWDSLRHIEMVFALEEEFGVNISAEEIAELFSDTSRVIDYLKTHAGE